MPYRALTAGNCTVTKTRRGNTTTLEMRATGGQGRRLPGHDPRPLHDDAAYVDLELTIEKPADNWPEAGWICLPFKVDAPQFRVGRNGFIMDPAKDIIPGANRYLYAVGTGVAIFDEQGRGVGVCAPDTPLVSLGEPGCWKFDRSLCAGEARRSTSTSSTTNGAPTTGSGTRANGPTVSASGRSTSMTPHGSLITPSLEMRYPVQTASVSARRASCRPSRQGCASRARACMVTAFGANPDGEGTLLRVWEQAGVSGELTVELPGGTNAATATPVNLRGEKTGEAVPIRSGTLTFDLGAYAPASFLLSR